MGFFKDLGTLRGQAKELERNRDVKGQMAGAMAQMQQANAFMAQQTQNTMLATYGTPTTATIAAVRPTGTVINMMPAVQLDLMVFRGGIPVPVTLTEAVPQVYLARARVGENLHVKIDPNNVHAVWIDWVTPA